MTTIRDPGAFRFGGPSPREAADARRRREEARARAQREAREREEREERERLARVAREAREREDARRVAERARREREEREREERQRAEAAERRSNERSSSSSSSSSSSNDRENGCLGPADARRVPATCIVVEKTARGTQCGNPESVSIRVTNRCSTRVYTRVCLERAGKEPDCGAFGIRPGSAHSNWTCEGTGRWTHDAVFSEKPGYDWVCSDWHR